MTYVFQKTLAGHAAVVIFFVLSGFVLTLSLLNKNASYGSYLIRRWFRIYPIFFIVIVCSYGAHKIIGYPHIVTSDFLENGVIKNDLSLGVFLKTILLWGTRATTMLDCVGWSLVHEVRISILFPLILMIVKKYRAKSLIGFFLISASCSAIHWTYTGYISDGTNDKTVAASYLATIFYIFFFAVGSYIALHKDYIISAVTSMRRWHKILFFIIAAMCMVKQSSLTNLSGMISDYINCIGAVLIICLSMGVNKFQMMLNHTISIWLGRVSYSLYLIHVPILYVINQTIGKNWGGLKTSVATIVISLVLAEVCAKAIEFPSIKLGKKLSS